MDKIQVVLAENDASVVAQLSEYVKADERLELAGVAYDGRDALDKIIKVQPDIIVMELLMPYIDGFALLDQLRQSTELEKMPQVIVTSTMSNEIIVKESFKLGANYFIVKPYEMNMVTERIKQMCQSDQWCKDTITYSMDIDSVISSDLIHMGVPASLKGYTYMITAIKEVIKDPTSIHGVTKVLYPAVAKQHNSTPSRVEKAIRHAIEVAWQRNPGEGLIKQLDSISRSGAKRPTNSEFIALVSRKIKMSA